MLISTPVEKGSNGLNFTILKKQNRSYGKYFEPVLRER